MLSNKLTFICLLSNVQSNTWGLLTNTNTRKIFQALETIFLDCTSFASCRSKIICAILASGVNKLQLIIKYQFSYWKTAPSQKGLAGDGCDNEARAPIPPVCESHRTVNSFMTATTDHEGNITYVETLWVLSLKVQDQTHIHLPGWEKESSAKAAKNLDLST